MTENPKNILLYDGECPLCSRYKEYIELRKKYDLKLYNAREHPDLIQRLEKLGYSINKGMILLIGDQVYHKHQAIEMLAWLTDSRGRWDSALRKVLRVPFLLKICYPFLFFMRWIMVKWRGKETRI